MRAGTLEQPLPLLRREPAPDVVGGQRESEWSGAAGKQTERAWHTPMLTQIASR